ncbi:MAG: hypothetical protein AB1634_11880 [Thermodesulfobacteriota bacterium]
MTESQRKGLVRLGFTFGKGGTHVARTMMLEELAALLAHGNPETVTSDAYTSAIAVDNCLGKPSGRARQLTRRHLVSLYALDPDVLLFRALRFFWQRDETGQPLLALLCACARDAVLRESAPFLLDIPLGKTITRVETQVFVERTFPERFSPATLKSVAQNINGTWTRSGHLKGKVKKVRARPQVTAGAAAYALLLAYLRGGRGMNLFASEYVKLLDCGRQRAIELAEEASRRGWLVFKSIGDVVEVQFPRLLRAEEKELVREQA